MDFSDLLRNQEISQSIHDYLLNILLRVDTLHDELHYHQKDKQENILCTLHDSN